MKITIECHCGQRYDAEFEPAAGRVPQPITCPGCGTDATATINDALAPVPAAAPPRPPLRKAEPVPTTASPAPVAAEAPARCFRHPDQPVEVFCFVCKKPMCAACMELYGFVCSPYCRRQAKERGLEIPEYEKQRDVVARQQQKHGKRVALAATLGVVALGGLWLWYAFWGSQPHVTHTFDLGQGEAQFCQFVGPHQLLVANGTRVALFDTGRYRPLWKTDAPGAAGRAEPGAGPFVTPQRVWVQRGPALIQIDRATGQTKATVSVPGQIRRVAQHATSLVVESADNLLAQRPANQEHLTYIDLATGKAASQVVTILIPPPPPVRRADNEPGSGAEEELQKPRVIEARTEFIPVENGVLRCDITIARTNIVSYQAIKAGQPLADNEMSVANSAAIAAQVVNDMTRQRTGGIRYADESVYRVTLQRVLGGPATNWTGEVTGPPAVFPLTTLNLLIAGRELIALDQQNRKLWASKLPYPVAPALLSPEIGDQISPALEDGDTVYVFDQGVLTAFARATGDVRWRLASVGVTQIGLDAQGMLYVTTSTANPEDIQYTQQFKLGRRVEAVIMKVDPRTGKTLWRMQQSGDHFYLADGVVYCTESSGSGLQDFANMAGGHPVTGNFRIFRIAPRSGKRLWEYYRAGGPEAVAFQGATIALVSDGQLEILKYLAF